MIGPQVTSGQVRRKLLSWRQVTLKSSIKFSSLIFINQPTFLACAAMADDDDQKQLLDKLNVGFGKLKYALAFYDPDKYPAQT